MKKFIGRLMLLFAITLAFALQISASAVECKNALAVDFLDKNSVIIAKNKCADVGGTIYKFGKRETTKFENSESGRKALSDSVSEPLSSAILNLWDNFPVRAHVKSRAKFLNSEGDVTLKDDICISLLNDRYAEFLKTKYINVDGVDYATNGNIGKSRAALFENSDEGRALLAKSVPSPFLSVVIAIWGDAPTIVVTPENLEKTNFFA